MSLSSASAKRCYTVNAWCVHENKVMLVKHKKLGIWLAPGGHVDDNELPHQAAEREFYEETGITGEVISAYPLLHTQGESEYLPLPFYCNLHAINKPRGNSFCEQHYSFGYFIKLLDAVHFGQNYEETDGIGWFAADEILNLETKEDIRTEAKFVFNNFPL